MALLYTRAILYRDIHSYTKKYKSITKKIPRSKYFCKEKAEEDVVVCDACGRWVHYNCVGLSHAGLDTLGTSSLLHNTDGRTDRQTGVLPQLSLEKEEVVRKLSYPHAASLRGDTTSFYLNSIVFPDTDLSVCIFHLTINKKYRNYVCLSFRKIVVVVLY